MQLNSLLYINSIYRHGNGNFFSCRGIQLAVQYFRDRGHQHITVFVPSWRKESSKPDSPITDQDILLHLEKEGLLVFTPSKRIGEKRIVCYDDRFILKLATTNGGVIVSNDHYRDLLNEGDAWRETIENRVLMFTFAKDLFMVPDDPYGRNGPSLEQLLRFDTSPPPKIQTTQKQLGKICPYADKCTFGKKCRFYHPEREEANYAGRITSGSSTPVPEQKLSHSLGHSRANSTEDDHYLESSAQPLPTKKLDIAEIEDKLSALNITPELHVTESEQVYHLNGAGQDRTLVLSMLSQGGEHPTHRCSSATQMATLEMPKTTAEKRYTYPITQPPGNQSKLASHPPVARASSPQEHMRNSLPPIPQRMHRDMNGQLLSRGVPSEAMTQHMPLPQAPPPQTTHPSHPSSLYPGQYASPNPSNSAHYGERGVYYPQQCPSFGHHNHHQHHNDPYGSTYFGHPTDPPPDQSRYPQYVERDYQSVHQSNLYINVRARLGHEYDNKIILFLQHYPHVQNVDYIVEHILHNF